MSAGRYDNGARVELSHGGGGRAMQQLIDRVFKPAFDNPCLKRGNDQAQFALAGGRYAFSTDRFSLKKILALLPSQILAQARFQGMLTLIYLICY